MEALRGHIMARVLYFGDADVASLDGTEPIGEDEVCDNYCDFAFDGECDDGGPGSLYRRFLI